MDLFWLKYIPKNWLSYAVGVLVHLPLPAPLSTWSIQWFASRYNINLEEAEHPIQHYKSIGEFFTRKLKPGIRPIGDGLVHPVDGKLTIKGQIEADSLIQAKGRSYSLTQFLKDERALPSFSGGVHLTYYLCPTDYHRVHMPLRARIVRVTYIPGFLWPVNEWSVANVDKLFAINERVVLWLETDRGPAALVMVGATNVGKMSLSFDDEIITNQKLLSPRMEEKTYSPPIVLEKGAEVGTFHMGSTVVMLYSKELLSRLPEGGEVKMGQSLVEPLQ